MVAGTIDAPRLGGGLRSEAINAISRHVCGQMYTRAPPLRVGRAVNSSRTINGSRGPIAVAIVDAIVVDVKGHNRTGSMDGGAHATGFPIDFRD